MEVTEELFKKYEEIRKSGKYNMFMDGSEVMREMKLNPRHASDRDLYLSIIKNYSAYAEKWLRED